MPRLRAVYRAGATPSDLRHTGDVRAMIRMMGLVEFCALLVDLPTAACAPLAFLTWRNAAVRNHLSFGPVPAYEAMRADRWGGVAWTYEMHYDYWFAWKMVVIKHGLLVPVDVLCALLYGQHLLLRLLHLHGHQLTTLCDGGPCLS